MTLNAIISVEIHHSPNTIHELQFIKVCINMKREREREHTSHPITLFRSITLICGIDIIQWIILKYSPHSIIHVGNIIEYFIHIWPLQIISWWLGTVLEGPLFLQLIILERVQKFGHDFIVTLGGIFWPNVGSLVELHKMSFGNYINSYGSNLPNLK